MSYCLVEDSGTQLREASRTGTSGDIQMLLDMGADVNSQNLNGETALHIATCLGKASEVIVLLANQADPDLANHNGQTPLHLAASHGYNEVVKALLEVACDSNMKTKYTEMTALHMASRNGHTDTVKLLLDNGADTEQKDVINKNAAFYAANQEILEMLQAHAGAELNSKSDGNQNVLNMLDKEKPQEQRKQPGIFDKKVTFSKKHKKIMKMSVFDRLTRSKSQLHVLK